MLKINIKETFENGIDEFFFFFFLFKCLRLFSYKGKFRICFSANSIADLDEGGKLTPKLQNRV
jgi:hypothetical protein